MIEPDDIYNKTLFGAEAVFAEVRDDIIRTVSSSYRTLPIPSVLNRIRSLWASSSVVLVDHLADTNLAAWVGGIDSVSKQFPAWLWQHFTHQLWGGKQPEPFELNLFPHFRDNDSLKTLRLPIIDKAVSNLVRRNVMTRPQWDLAREEEQKKAFFITADLGEKAIETIRDVLVEDVSAGQTIRAFQQKLAESIEGSALHPAHVENIYRTNVQAAYRDGKETMASHPIVAGLFPYQRYTCNHDARTRTTHRALERLGLNGTGIYRRDDPFWDFYTPPWGYQCRCGTMLLTIEQAARLGVREAMDWLRSGRPPAQPEHRLEHIPFPPEPGFGYRGIVRMSSVDRAGHKHKGKGQGGGQFTSDGDGAQKTPAETSKTGQKATGKAKAVKAPAKVAELHPVVLAKAAEQGDSPEHREARTVVAKHYFANMAVAYDHKTGTMVPLKPNTQEGMLDGIDLSKPVTLGPPPAIPPPRKMVQWQAEGGYRGSYFSVEGVKPQELGIYEQATAWTLPGQPVLPRRQKAYDTKKAKLDRISYLQSVTAPTIDTWSVPGKHVAVAGGGPQWYVPVAAHPQVRIPVTK